MQRRTVRRAVVSVAAIGATAIAGLAPAAAATSLAPPPVTHVSARSAGSAAVALSWQNPSSARFSGTLVRMAKGDIAPASPTKGTKVSVVSKAHHSLTVGKLSAGTRYSFALFATDGDGHYAARAKTAATTGPGPVTAVAAFDHKTYVGLQWTDPKTPSFSGVVVRYAKGAAAPATPTSGTAVALTHAKAIIAKLAGLARDTEYSVAIWTHDAGHHYSTRTVSHFYTQEGAQAPVTISGTVADGDGHPLQGVVVGVDQIVFISFESADQPGAAPNDSEPGTATTDAAGHYSLQIPAGGQIVYFDGSQATGGSTDATGYLSDERPVSLPAGHSHATVNETLSGGAAFTGTVTDTGGQPVGGLEAAAIPVEPYVYGDGGGVHGSLPEPAFAAVSGTDGTFTVKGVTPGAEQICVVLASGDGGSCQPRSIYAKAGQTVATQDLSLRQPDSGTVAGKVTTTGGAPVADAAVILEPRSPGVDLGGIAFTGADGKYQVADVPPGRYRACAEPSNADGSTPGPALSPGSVSACAAGITVTANATATVDIALPAGGAVTGKVVGPHGGRLPGVEVDIEGGQFGEFDDTTTTDAAGRFAVNGLPSGKYQACFEAPDVVAPTSPTGFAPTCYGHEADFSVTAGQIRLGIDVRLAAGGAISGTVRDRAGHPAAGAYVVADPGSQSGAGGLAISGADGRYFLTGLAAGRYQVCVFEPTGDGGCVARLVTVHVGATTTDVNAQVASTGRVSVTVTDGNDQPVAGADVAVLAACGPGADCHRENVFSPTKVDVAASDVTDADGHITFDGLPVGSYAVCTFAYYGVTAGDNPPAGLADKCTGNTFTVTVSADHTTNVTQTLDPAGAVTGIVTDELGDPLRNARLKISGSAATDYDNGEDADFGDPLDALGAPSSGPQSDAFTGTDGTFTVNSVTPGTQQVCVDASDVVGGTSTTGYKNRCVTATITVTAGQTTGDVVVKLKPAA